MYVLFSAAQELFKGSCGWVIQSGVYVAHTLHPILGRHGDRYQATEETDLHTHSVFTAVLVVGVQDLIRYPCHPIGIQAANVSL